MTYGSLSTLHLCLYHCMPLLLFPLCLCLIFSCIFCSLCLYWFIVLFWKYWWRPFLHPSPLSRKVASTKRLLLVALFMAKNKLPCLGYPLALIPLIPTTSCCHVHACLRNCICVPDREQVYLSMLRSQCCLSL